MSLKNPKSLFLQVVMSSRENCLTGLAVLQPTGTFSQAFEGSTRIWEDQTQENGENFANILREVTKLARHNAIYGYILPRFSWSLILLLWY